MKQFQTIKRAYDSLTYSKPELPESGSLLPALIAAEELEKAVKIQLSTVDSVVDQIEGAEHDVRTRDSSLKDAKALGIALQTRLSKLQAAEAEYSQKPPAQAARDLLTSKVSIRKNMTAEVKRLRESLYQFVEDHLCDMIAAEELGGPVVGELIDVDEDMLEAGFSSQGQPKKSEKVIPVDKRQRRIDEIWGKKTQDEGQPQEAPNNAHEAAYQEFTELIDSLLDAAQGKSESGPYLTLERDSAASRFLVRAKVAEYRPKDARRLRLIDFAGEYES